MQADRAECIARVVASEGGYVNHPADPGGPTNFGITLADYRRYLNPDAQAADVRAMRLDEAKAIYRAHYWDAVSGDALPAGVDYCVFDYAVNSGTARAAKVLQRVLGCAVNGRVDEATLRLATAADAGKLVAAICDERLRFLRSLKTWGVFGAGWSRRVQEVRTASLAMAKRGTPPPRSPAPPIPGKGAVPVNTRAQTGATAVILTAGGIGAAVAADATTAVIVIALSVAAAAGGWAFWHWLQRRRQDAPAAAPGQTR